MRDSRSAAPFQWIATVGTIEVLKRICHIRGSQKLPNLTGKTEAPALKHSPTPGAGLGGMRQPGDCSGWWSGKWSWAASAPWAPAISARLAHNASGPPWGRGSPWAILVDLPSPCRDDSTSPPGVSGRQTRLVRVLLREVGLCLVVGGPEN